MIVQTSHLKPSGYATLPRPSVKSAALWTLLGFVFTGVGLMHAYQLSGNTVDYLLVGTQPAEGAMKYRGFPIAVGYLAMAVVFLLVGVRERRSAA